MWWPIALDCREQVFLLGWERPLGGVLHVHVATVPWIQGRKAVPAVMPGHHGQSGDPHRPTEHNEIHSASSFRGSSRTPLEPALPLYRPQHPTRDAGSLSLHVAHFLLYELTLEEPRGHFSVIVTHPQPWTSPLENLPRGLVGVHLIASPDSFLPKLPFARFKISLGCSIQSPWALLFR